MKQFSNTSTSFIISTTILLIFIIHYPLFIIHSQAQDEEIINPQAVNTIIKTNPLTILWGSIPLTAEYRVMVEQTSSKNQSDQIGISYLGKSPVLKLFEDSTEDSNLLIVRGFRFQASHKFYINKLGDLLGLPFSEYAPHGLYISPHLSYSTAKFSTKFLNSRDVFIRITHFNVNFLVGYQLIHDFWALDFFVGLGYKVRAGHILKKVNREGPPAC